MVFVDVASPAVAWGETKDNRAGDLEGEDENQTGEGIGGVEQGEEEGDASTKLSRQDMIRTISRISRMSASSRIASCRTYTKWVPS